MFPNDNDILNYYFVIYLYYNMVTLTKLMFSYIITMYNHVFPIAPTIVNVFLYANILLNFIGKNSLNFLEAELIKAI